MPQLVRALVECHVGHSAVKILRVSFNCDRGRFHERRVVRWIGNHHKRRVVRAGGRQGCGLQRDIRLKPSDGRDRPCHGQDLIGGISCIVQRKDPARSIAEVIHGSVGLGREGRRAAVAQ